MGESDLIHRDRKIQMTKGKSHMKAAEAFDSMKSKCGLGPTEIWLYKIILY